jgi:hypothetical protein
MFNPRNITGTVVVRVGILMTSRPRATAVTVISLVQKEGPAARLVHHDGDVVGLSSFYYGNALR